MRFVRVPGAPTRATAMAQMAIRAIVIARTLEIVPSARRDCSPFNEPAIKVKTARARPSARAPSPPLLLSPFATRTSCERNARFPIGGALTENSSWNPKGFLRRRVYRRVRSWPAQQQRRAGARLVVVFFSPSSRRSARDGRMFRYRMCDITILSKIIVKFVETRVILK